MGNRLSGAPFEYTTVLVATVMRRLRGSKGKRAISGSALFATSTETPTRRAKTSMAASIGSPTGIHSPSSRIALPVEHRPAARAVCSRCVDMAGESRATSPSGSYPVPRMQAVPRGVHTSTTAILFWVRVPVLSVQRKVVDPNVSTASRRRTKAWCVAIRCAPIARERVTVGSSASGTRATITPMPKTRPDWTSIPRMVAVARNATPTPTAMMVVVRTRRRISLARGV